MNQPEQVQPVKPRADWLNMSKRLVGFTVMGFICQITKDEQNIPDFKVVRSTHLSGRVSWVNELSKLYGWVPHFIHACAN